MSLVDDLLSGAVSAPDRAALPAVAEMVRETGRRPRPNTIEPGNDQWGRHIYEDDLPPDEIVPDATPDGYIGVTSQLKPIKNDFSTYDISLTAEYAVRNSEAWLKLDEEAAIELIKGAKQRSLRKAANRGSSIHAVVDAIRDGDLSYATENPDAVPYLDAVRAFVAEARPAFLLGEIAVVNRTLRYAGKFDAVGTVEAFPEPGTVMFDWKTRNKHQAYQDNAAQLAAYAHAEYMVLDGRRQRLPKIDGGAVVTFCPDGTWELHPIDLEAAWPLAQVAIRCYQLKSTTKAIGKPPVASAVPATTDATVMAALEASLAATHEPDPSAATSAGPADPEIVEWLHARVLHIRDHLAGRPLPIAWPDGVPTFKAGGPTTVEQTDVIERWCDATEKVHELPFGPAKPRPPVEPPADLVGPAQAATPAHTLQAASLLQDWADDEAQALLCIAAPGVALSELDALDEAQVQLLGDLLSCVDGDLVRLGYGDDGAVSFTCTEAAAEKLLELFARNKQDVLTAARAAAKAAGAPGPRRFDDVATDPRLLALTLRSGVAA